MSDDTTTQSASTESTSQPRSWRGYEPLFVNLHLVFWLILMTPSIVSLAVMWLLANTLHRRAGIGINAGRIRGINSRIRGGEVQHTGVVPFLKKFEATVRCCTQNGIRGWFSNCPLSYLAPRNQRHPRPQKQQRNRGQQSQKTRLQHPVK